MGVEDVIQGILLAWKKGISGNRYILSGENWTIQKLFQEISYAAGVEAPKLLLPSPVLHGLGMFGDFLSKCGLEKGISRENAWTSTLYHWFDNSKARRELGFNPAPSREGIVKSIEWVKKNGLIR